MNKTLFCYEISADAGLAYDKISGKNAKAYTKVEIELKHQLNEAEYKQVHEIELVTKLSNQLGIEEEHFKPISIVEFLDNNTDEC